MATALCRGSRTPSSPTTLSDHHPDLIVRPEDMDFIVAARTRWPAALARIRELEAKCKGLEEEAGTGYVRRFAR